MKKNRRKKSLPVEIPERETVHISLLPCNIAFHRLRKLPSAAYFIFSVLNKICAKKKKR